MYLIKIMSDQDLPDNDMTKNYKMIAIGAGDQFEFYHDSVTGYPRVLVTPKGDESYSSELTGNAYVISETGKTVATHWARTLWGKDQESLEADIASLRIIGTVHVRYYGQVLGEFNEPVPYDYKREPGVQQYTLTNNVPIAVTSTNFGDKENGEVQLTGSGIIEFALAPNKGDLFTTERDDGSLEMYSITEVIRFNANGKKEYAITWKFIGLATGAIVTDLSNKVVQVLNLR